jgi:hypothetical protein
MCSMQNSLGWTGRLHVPDESLITQFTLISTTLALPYCRMLGTFTHGVEDELEYPSQSLG